MNLLTRGLAGIAVSAFLFNAAPAQADPHSHMHDSIRYASIKGCPKKDKSLKPCSPWRLFTHEGMVIKLKDAQVTATNEHGKPVNGALGPITVSGDGQYVAYFRARDRRLAV